MPPYANTYTKTHTKVDVRKVFENFAADLSMLAMRTGTMGQQWVQDTAHDVELMALWDCLRSVHVQSFDAYGRLQKAHRYNVVSGGALGADRPGANDWNSTPGGHLAVIIFPSDADKFNRLEREKQFRRRWSPSNSSTNYSGMRSEPERQYSSNGYGLTRDSFSAT